MWIVHSDRICNYKTEECEFYEFFLLSTESSYTTVQLILILVSSVCNVFYIIRYLELIHGNVNGGRVRSSTHNEKHITVLTYLASFSRRSLCC